MQLNLAFSRIRELVQQSEGILQLAVRLEQRLLAKAFCGQLLPQDPLDESALVLIERARHKKKVEITSSKPSKALRTVSDPSNASAGLRSTHMEKTRGQVKSNHLSTILASTKSLTAAALWRRSDMSIEEFYKQLRAELAANHIRQEADNKLAAA